jgi:hypothetical protein
VHPLPSHIAYELCQARGADIGRRRHQPAGLTRRGRHPRAIRAVRQSTGWFLIELGLRLAAPQAPLGTVR